MHSNSNAWNMEFVTINYKNMTKTTAKEVSF